MTEDMPNFPFEFRPETQIKNIQYLPNWLNEQQAWEVFDLLRSQLPWNQGELNMFGKKVKIPRLECFLADPDITYTYSGQTLKTTDWPDVLKPILKSLRDLTHKPINACLANFYRNGHDKVGWHADDEPELGENPWIASLSLGASRTFQIKHNQSNEKHNFLLGHGSLLIMKNSFQSEWKHQIPAEKSVLGPRVNLTFRSIINN